MSKGAQVVVFPKHHPVIHTDCYEGGCMFCDGGLFACTRCNSFEGATTTDCPGEYMTREQADAVYEGTLDYVFDLGWVKSCSKHSPTYHGSTR